MNSLSNWSKYDTYYIIIAVVASFIFVGLGLIHYNNLFIKFIFFCVICVLLFLMLRYLHESNNLFGDKQSSSDWNTQTSGENEDSGGLQLESFSSIDESSTIKLNNGVNPEDTSDNSNTNFQLEPSLDLGSHKDSHVLEYNEPEVRSDFVDENGDDEDNIYNEERSDFVDNNGDNIYNQKLNTDDSNKFMDTKQKTIHELDKPDKPDLSHHIGTHPSNRSKKVGTSKPYDTPININISYITKNAITDSNFAKDDVISNNRIDGSKRPDETSHHLNTPHPDHNYGINYLNKKLSVDNSNKNTYSPPNVKCADGNCNNHSNHHSHHSKHHSHHSKHHSHHSKHHSHHSKHHSTHNEGNQESFNNNNDNTLIYSGTGYSYISNPPHTGNNVQGCPSSSCPVSPMEINQNWSDWNPQYLTGNDITENNK